MKKPVLIFKNIEREGPGLFGEILNEKGIPFREIELERGGRLPEPEAAGAIIVLGGPDSANDATLKMTGEIILVKRCLALGIPYLGICLGMQVLVKAAGGEVYPHTMKEIGCRDPDGNYFEVRLTGAGGQDPLMAGLPPAFPVFQLHGETVRFDDGVTLLGSGKFCKPQVVKAGRAAYGFQCHVELTRKMLERWMLEDADLRNLSKPALLQDFETLQSQYESTARKVFENFLAIAGDVCKVKNLSCES